MGDDAELRGVGGWLAFFVVIMAVISPLRMIAGTATNLYRDPQVAQAYGGVWPQIQAAEWAIVAASLAGGWFIAWRLFKVHVWTTVRITIAGIWIMAFGGLLLDLLAVSLIAGIPLESLTTGIALDMARPVGFCLIWTAYFLRSRRVANTYVRDPGADAVAEVFD